MGTGLAHGDVGMDEDDVKALRAEIGKGKGLGRRPPEMKKAQFWKEVEWKRYGWIPQEKHQAMFPQKTGEWKSRESVPHRRWEESSYTGSHSHWHQDPGEDKSQSWGQGWDDTASSSQWQESPEARYQRMSENVPWRSTWSQSERLSHADKVDTVGNWRQLTPTDLQGARATVARPISHRRIPRTPRSQATTSR